MEAILSREIIVNRTLCRLIGVAFFIIALALAAFVRIPLPFTPVPITLQTFFVLLSGAFLGAELGLSVQLGYLFLGAAGLPLFAGAASGPAYLMGPTGGYIFGFVLASLFIGRYIRYCGDSLWAILAIFLLGDLILLFSGALWLKSLAGCGIGKAFLLGVLPFIPGDLIKVAAAGLIYRRLRLRLRDIF